MYSRPWQLVAGITLAVLAAIGVHAVWYLFVNTATGQAIDRAAFEGALIQQSSLWHLGRPVLDLVSRTLILLGAGAAVLIALLRRRAWLAVQALLVIVGANVTTQLVKDWYSRPYLLSGWTGQNSLPSGHTTVVAAASVALLLTVPRRWRALVAVLGALWTLVTGISTLVGRWHRPADVVAALLVVCFWGALCALLGAARSRDLPRGRPSRSVPITVVIMAALAITSTVIAIGSLVRLYGYGSNPDAEANLAADILAHGELTAYVGGIGAVMASVFGVFGALLWLRHATLTVDARAPRNDNSGLVRYGANRAQ